MKDEDIVAFKPAPRPAPRPPRRLWPWVLGGLLALTLATVVGGTLALLALADSAREGVQVVIGGERWEAPLWGAQWGVFPALMAVLGTGGALLCVLLAVLLVVPAIIGVVLLCVALGLGSVLLVALCVVLATTSPLWLLLLILWLVLRKKPGPAPAAAPATATMGG